MTDIQEVWSWPAAIGAAIAGLVYSGFFVLSFLTLRRRRGYPVVVVINVLVGTFLFTLSQMVASIYIGDPFWYRVGSRYGMWVPFALVLGGVIVLVMRKQRAKGTL